MASETTSLTSIHSFDIHELSGRGSNFIQLDTGRVYYRLRSVLPSTEQIFHRASLAFRDQTANDLRGFDRAGVSSNTILTGKHFAYTRATKYFLLENDIYRGRDIRIEQDLNGGDDLILNNITVERSQTGALNGVDVAAFKQDNSHIYQVAPNLLGTNSFLLGGWFIDRRFNQNVDLLMYGTNSGKRIKITTTMTNELQLEIVSNTGGQAGNLIRTFPAQHLRDTKEHYIGVLADRVNQQIIFIVTNGTYEIAIAEFIDMPSTFGSFNAPNNALAIGSNWDGTTCRGTFFGEASNFPIFADWSGEVDYAAVGLILAGIRDNPASGVTITDEVRSTEKLSLRTTITGDVGAYCYALVKLAQGGYDINIQDALATDGGNAIIYMNNNPTSPMRQFAPQPRLVETVIRGSSQPKGNNFLKLEISTQDDASTGTNIRFNYWKFNKVSGGSEDSATSIVSLFEELTDLNKLVRAATAGTPYNNSLLNESGSVAENGVYGRGTIYAQAGLYKFSLGHTVSNDSGIIEFLVNGRVILTFDAYAITTRFNQAHILQVHIKQGDNKYEIRVAGKNPNSSGYHLSAHYFTLDLISNASNGNAVNVRALDNYYPTQNTQHQLSVLNSTVPFSSYREMSGVDTTAEVKKPFSGGLYMLRFYIQTNTNGGMMMITLKHRAIDIDDIVLFTGVNFNSITPTNKILTKLISIPRGHHYIEYKNLSGTNRFNLTTFDLFGRVALDGDDELIVNESGRVLLAVSEKHYERNVIVINLANVNADQFDRIEIEFNSRSRGSTSVAVRINETDTGYKKVGERNINGTVTSVSQQWTDHLELVSNSLVTTVDESYLATMDLIFGTHSDTARKLVQGFYRIGTQNKGGETGTIFIQDRVTKIDKLTFSATGSNFSASTVIKVFGYSKRS